MLKALPRILAILTIHSTLASAADQPEDQDKVRPAKPPLVPAAIIKQYDRDGDGKLSPQEWAAIPGLQKAPREKSADEGKIPGDTAKDEPKGKKAEHDSAAEFQKFDANRDGFVSLEELAARAGGPAKEGENKP